MLGDISSNNMEVENALIFNRIYIFIHGCFSIVMLVLECNKDDVFSSNCISK